MPKTRQEYELQHKEDIQKLNEYENHVQNHFIKLNIMELEIKRLNAVIEAQSTEIQILRSEAEYIKRHIPSTADICRIPKSKRHGAGRKPKLNNALIKYIHKYRSEGRTQREIADMLNISVGLVNKACHMPDK